MLKVSPQANQLKTSASAAELDAFLHPNHSDSDSDSDSDSNSGHTFRPITPPLSSPLSPPTSPLGPSSPLDYGLHTLLATLSSSPPTSPLDPDLLPTLHHLANISNIYWHTEPPRARQWPHFNPTRIMQLSDLLDKWILQDQQFAPALVCVVYFAILGKMYENNINLILELFTAINFTTQMLELTCEAQTQQQPHKKQRRSQRGLFTNNNTLHPIEANLNLTFYLYHLLTFKHELYVIDSRRFTSQELIEGLGTILQSLNSTHQTQDLTRVNELPFFTLKSKTSALAQFLRRFTIIQLPVPAFILKELKKTMTLLLIHHSTLTHPKSSITASILLINNELNKLKAEPESIAITNIIKKEVKNLQVSIESSPLPLNIGRDLFQTYITDIQQRISRSRQPSQSLEHKTARIR